MQHIEEKNRRISQSTGREMRSHIGIYGACNVGKSSLINLITSANTAIVSPYKGTTTDIVRKSYEIIDFAPVVFLDTAGIDDESDLKNERIRKSIESLSQVDMAILLFKEWGRAESELIDRFKKLTLPYIIIQNIWTTDSTYLDPNAIYSLDISCANSLEVAQILDLIKSTLPERSYKTPKMFGNKVKVGDKVVLVCPIDSEAPAGRLILPQVQAIRELLDIGAMASVVQLEQLSMAIKATKPTLIVVDSQVIAQAKAMTPEGVEITTFSTLLAASKGDIELYKSGLATVDNLKSGDIILIAESCTHQVSCEDIGRVKIPKWLKEYTNAELNFEIISGRDPLPDDVHKYALIAQCGGCMVTRSELNSRLRSAKEHNIPIVNFGMLIQKLRLAVD